VVGHLEGQPLLEVLKALAQEHRRWAVGEASRRRGHGSRNGCMEIPEVEDDHVNKSALLTCKRCGWEERLSDEMLERLVDAVLSLGPMP
jgi:hypothetical protein